MEKNETLLAENKTIYSTDIFKKLNYLFIKKRLILIFAIALILCCVGALMVGFNLFRTLGYIYIGSALVIVVMAVIRMYVSVSKAVKRNDEKNKNVVIKYSFYETYMVVNTINNDVDVSQNKDYNTFTRIEETSDCLFMFVNEHSALCLDKNAFVTGTAKNVREILQAKVLKYKLYKGSKE